MSAATTLAAAPPAPAAPSASATPSIRLLPPRSTQGAERVRTLLRRAGLRCEPSPDRTAREHAAGPDAPPGAAGTVTVVVADDAGQVLPKLPDCGPLLLVCDTVTRSGLRQAMRAGAVVLRAADLTERSLLDAVRRAGAPDRSIPYPVLSQLLTRGFPADPPERGPAAGGADRNAVRPTLTARQTSVLRLMAEGHANADIARLLSCSEHTVKNIVYEVMSRLQARNRAHAVAHALRHGLI